MLTSDNYSPDDYELPRSPVLRAFRPELRINSGENYISDSDEELDINSPWISELRSRPRNYNMRKRRRGDKDSVDPILTRWGETKSHKKGDQCLVDMMGPDILWKVGNDVLFEPLPGSGTAHTRRSSRPYFKRVRFSKSKEDGPYHWQAIRPRKQILMPLIVQGKKGLTEVMACPDTGSDDNIVSLELAEELGLQLMKEEEHKAFVLANGKKITALGKALLNYGFGSGQGATLDTGALTCTVYVFQTLIVPALLGAAFLAKNEIYTKNRHLLIEQMVPSGQALQVKSIGTPKRGLFCRLDTSVTYAAVDTGSDLDLVSPQFAREKGFQVEPIFEELQFADGSTGTTSGVFEVSFAIGNVDSSEVFRPREETIIGIDFFVLDGISSDVIIGEDTLQELGVLDQHKDLFVPLPQHHGQSDCNPIRLIGRKEGRLGTIMELARAAFRSKDRNETDSNDRDRERHRLLEIQRENARQEAIEDSESKLPLSLGNGASPPNSPPSHARLNNGEDLSDSDEPLSDAQGTVNSCPYPGCTAASLRTKYLLKCHMDVHKSSQPHYCPVSGCPRSEGGRGFRRKNEMIQHGLVHDSPGYICPYCPDREHRYPRPDNLQRHVRVHHVDKKKDDPILSEALKQPQDLFLGKRRRALVAHAPSVTG